MAKSRTPREGADVVFLRQQQSINEEYNASASEATPTGARVSLSARQVARILELTEGHADEVAESLRTLFRGIEQTATEPEEAPFWSAEVEVSAGQPSYDEPGPTSFGFWYATSSHAVLNPWSVWVVIRGVPRAASRRATSRV